MADDDAIRCEYPRCACWMLGPHYRANCNKVAALSANRLHADATPDDRQGPDDAAR